MSKFTITYPPGATPIDPDEMGDLIPDYISTWGELNQLEQSNIADAHVWAGKQNLDDLLTATFVFKLHEKMFNQVWKWAGRMRRSNKNIGVVTENIMNNLGMLLGDAAYWIQHKSFSPDEIATRFHYRLVQIHIFPNGNGRHSRMLTDLLLLKMSAPKFSWGTQGADTPIEVEGPTRKQYIKALKLADKDDFSKLIQFVRS